MVVHEMKELSHLKSLCSSVKKQSGGHPSEMNQNLFIGRLGHAGPIVAIYIVPGSIYIGFYPCGKDRRCISSGWDFWNQNCWEQLFAWNDAKLGDSAAVRKKRAKEAKTMNWLKI